MSTTEAVDELQRIAARSQAQIGAENFPVALRLLPAAPRAALARVYGFARFVDDVGDESNGDRLALLDLVADDVQALWSGQAQLPPVLALAGLTETVPQRCLLDLVEANRVDQRVGRYETFDDLLGYCRLSAAPVGRIVLALAAVTDPVAIERSDAVCNALQVLEHCQDITEDARAGRVYLPSEELHAAGVVDADLVAAASTQALRRVVSVQVDRASELLVQGRLLVKSLHGWARFAVAGYVGGGFATVDAIHGVDYDTLASAVIPGKLRTVTHALRLIARR